VAGGCYPDGEVGRSVQGRVLFEKGYGSLAQRGENDPSFSGREKGLLRNRRTVRRGGGGKELEVGAGKELPRITDWERKKKYGNYLSQRGRKKRDESENEENTLLAARKGRFS